MDQRAALPEFLDEIAAVVGVELALKLAVARGGTEVYLPSKPEPDHWLSQLMGHEQALKLCTHLRVGNSGMRHLIPMGTPQSTATRWRRMHELIDKGLSKREIARLCGVHQRTVQLHRRMKREGNGNLARVEAVLRQLSLFD